MHVSVHFFLALLARGIESSRDISLLLAFIALVLLCVVAELQKATGRMFEPLIKIHIGFSLVFVASLTTYAWNSSRVILLVFLGLSIAFWFLKIGQTLYRTVVTGIIKFDIKRPEYCKIPVVDALHINIRLGKELQIHPGQYVYLRVLGLKRCKLSVVQSHPLFICWWRDHEIAILLERQGGLSRLLEPTGESTKLFIEGPYGIKIDLSPYSTMLFCATGVGIAALLPFI
ncbi:hypothetical protein BU23DRAFT_574400 [Bimuria novae-zelandiae CBS 107.79]|uniref:ferric-chelate reductase (NADPH) n=1 Tax=Bimuria novae-zelandiae CBS 107.79 TaxID=1447943 RepID=A0A6A5UT03_9PLEO|nr:hypothetical protein BU23DRAFT_574400 [Bimuria novae-zelandiae CBS 107.79]